MPNRPSNEEHSGTGEPGRPARVCRRSAFSYVGMHGVPRLENFKPCGVVREEEVDEQRHPSPARSEVPKQMSRSETFGSDSIIDGYLGCARTH
jgi:hypothetical protein